MKKRIFLAGIAILLLAGSILVVPILGLSQIIISYVDQIHSANADIIIRYYPLLLIVYFIAYVLIVALCLPLAALMALIGGLMFGFAGFLTALLSVTLGSVVPFLASRKFARPALAKIDSEMVQRARRGFDRNPFQYLVLMRLVPWAPFTVTTIVAGALGMDLVSFLAGTALGFVPVGLALNAVGHGLRRLAELRNISVAQLYRDPDFLMATGGVGAIALLTLLRKVPAVSRLFG
jgi:uncharacterized membrane protein YdjX (TVP38/TMEM64 family)